MINKTIIIEKQKPLSQSQFLTGQRAFYYQKGVDTWTDEVPFILLVILILLPLIRKQ